MATTSADDKEPETPVDHEKAPPKAGFKRSNTTFFGEPSIHRSLFPWAGILALLSIVFLTGASAVILLASNHSPLTKWKWGKVDIEPQVWLSILSTLMDGLTMFAFANGVAILYWRAVSRGTTLRTMWELYESQAFFGAIHSLIRRSPNYVGIAALLCTISALRGPLFQHASSVDGEFSRHSSATHDIRVAQVLPPSYLYPHHFVTKSSCDFVYDLHVARMPIYIEEDTCKHNCVSTGKVKGYGFDIECEESSIPWDDNLNSTVRSLFQDPRYQSVPGLVPSFNTSAKLPGWNPMSETAADVAAFAAAEERGEFEVTSLYKTQPICGGELSVTKCKLRHAIVEYEFELEANSIRLKQKNWQDDKVLYPVPAWNMFNETNLLDIRPLWGATSQWSSLYWQQFNQEISINSNNSDYTFLSNHDPRAILAKKFTNGRFDTGDCNTTFIDPTQYTLNHFRELAFRTAVSAANNVTDPKELFSTPSLSASGLHHTRNWTQTVDLAIRETLAVYTVSYVFLGCGIAVSLLSVAAITPLYWGWTEVTGPTSFNPLDVARAFDAPVMEGLHGKGVEQMVRRREGGRGVRYCRVESGGEVRLKVQWAEGT
ncbi:hypothetical protein BS50DRAFT_677221 [Corynespora cassiicola Philippines]|uniref:Uncharacterized protein n=1 Tax=Corynespora cassiicola Philippines TaxID=1448308 RepID=A0A2T2NKD2_CORCC|nr:hypothetical protein BS50DRAFT_677221 [Corynespora cassiicola Philippines]